MKRRVSQNLRDGSFSLTLWADTEDEKSFKVRAPKTKPYVMAYGIRYDLTAKERKTMRELDREFAKLHTAVESVYDTIRKQF